MLKKRPTAFGSDWIMRPSVGFTLLYAGPILGWFLYVVTTLRLPTIWQEGAFRMLPARHYWGLTLLNIGLAAWLLASLRRALSAPRGLARGQTIGVLLALTFVALVQYGAQGLHRAWPPPVEDRAAIDAHVASLPLGERRIVADLRALLAERWPGYRERLTRTHLHMGSELELQGWLATSESEVSFELVGGPTEAAGVPDWVGDAASIRIDSTGRGRVRGVVAVTVEPGELAELHRFLTIWSAQAP